ncbi:hypothetical protein JJL56_01635 [Azospirillum sp. YIM DDC1]|uniref:Uncharacterized protein n=1 Tax=Azospirillum aestuarii TaxID=2802052 RepID=A0ABS1HRW9_9PROT|nr:hypothetical protein [Azospirillum aestuarii]MBK4717562.1 hypothetical protein [Azospirillum aestuarii]
MSHIINVPADTLIAGLRQRRDELAEQLARLERTQQSVANDLDALEQAMQVIGGQRSRAAAPAVASQALPPSSPPARVGALGSRRGDLPAAIRRVLAEYASLGPLTTADVVEAVHEHIPPTVANKDRIGNCLNQLSRIGMVTGKPSGANSRMYEWSLTDKGRAAVQSEGGSV